MSNIICSHNNSADFSLTFLGVLQEAAVQHSGSVPRDCKTLAPLTELSLCGPGFTPRDPAEQAAHPAPCSCPLQRSRSRLLSTRVEVLMPRAATKYQDGKETATVSLPTSDRSVRTAAVFQTQTRKLEPQAKEKVYRAPPRGSRGGGRKE